MRGDVEVSHLTGRGTMIGVMVGSMIATEKEIINGKGLGTGMTEAFVTETGGQIGSTVIQEMEEINSENVTEAGHTLLLDLVRGGYLRVQFINIRGRDYKGRFKTFKSEGRYLYNSNNYPECMFLEYRVSYFDFLHM